MYESITRVRRKPDHPAWEFVGLSKNSWYEKPQNVKGIFQQTDSERDPKE